MVLGGEWAEQELYSRGQHETHARTFQKDKQDGEQGSWLKEATGVVGGRSKGLLFKTVDLSTCIAF